MSRYVTLVNRTAGILQGVWNGRQWKIVPGKSEWPVAQAVKFKEQNPIKGTQDPITLQMEYLCGIEEYSDDCSPIEQSDKLELTDRSKLPESQQKVTLVSGEGLYAPRNIDRKPLPGADVNFVKP